MSLFLSTYINRIDKKGRVSVPSSFRSILEQNGLKGMICYPAPALGSIEGCSLNRMKKISDAIEASGPFTDERTSFSTSIFADSHQINFDQEGRVIIPNELLNFSGIEDQVTFVGMGETFQMWKPETYQSYKAKTSKEAQDNLTKLSWRNE